MSSPILDVGDKLTVGQFDLSSLDVSTKLLPGTTVLNGPCYIGANASPGIARAACMIGPTLFGNPNSLEVIGITNFYGVFNSFSLNTFTGISNIFGLTTKFAATVTSGIHVKNALNNANGPSVCNGTLNIFGPMTTPFIKAGVGEFVELNAPGKHFDIPHPSKPRHRLIHACLEGPEYGVYFRGKLKDKTYIELPKFWDNLINPETITVHLTPNRIYQELYVKSIEWGKIINISNNLGGPIDCDFVVYAERIDIDKLVVEREEKK